MTDFLDHAAADELVFRVLERDAAGPAVATAGFQTQETGEAGGERRLAGAVRTEDRHRFPGADYEIDAAQHDRAEKRCAGGVLEPRDGFARPFSG